MCLSAQMALALRLAGVETSTLKEGEGDGRIMTVRPMLQWKCFGGFMDVTQDRKCESRLACS